MFEFEESLSWFLFEISVLVLGSGFWFGFISSFAAAELVCPGRSLTSGWDGVVHPSCRFQKKSERHEIALEPHWFRVQTERIKRSGKQQYLVSWLSWPSDSNSWEPAEALEDTEALDRWERRNKE
ncbi:BQ5605_C045g12200 [Microbotryum silenes-dioicae]|uniref:BQ5605_C045g12200 protein n=1 Tax=Microbotryum silenes-dioicae TaxID=796604 RepID=A0A2X0NHX4_9BASI|nr:BQ5605_C045g12200 [Microbotryum silenes-dioicae]